MKTIEQLLKPIISADIQYLLNEQIKVKDFTLQLTNDFNMASKVNDKYIIQAILKTGQGTRSTIKGITANQAPMSIVFQVPLNNVQEFLALLNKYCLATNAYWAEVTDDMQDEDTSTSIEYQYQFAWGVAIPNQIPYDITVKAEDKVKSESIEVEQIVLTGQVTYTSSIKMDDEEYYLYLTGAVPTNVKSLLDSTVEYYQSQGEAYKEEIGIEELPLDLTNYSIGFAIKVNDESTTDYYIVGYTTTLADGYVKIEGIVSDTEDLAPTVNSTTLLSQYQPEKDVSGDTQSLQITIAVMTSNTLHQRLLQLFYTSRTGSSFDFKIRQTRASMSIDTDDIDVIIAINKFKQNGFEYLRITITRV